MSEDILIYPTDTVWGIGTSLKEREGPSQIRAIKKNPSVKPLSILFDSEKEFKKFVKIPNAWSSLSLNDLFGLELTLLLPASWWTGPAIDHVIGDSPLIGVRILSIPWVPKKAFPITTTSLNLVDMPPIVEESKAREFREKFCPQALFLSAPSSATLSGRSSTIIKINEDRVSLVREGNYAKKLIDFLKAAKIFQNFE
ncbi:MAG: hypothetical protein HN509_01085 [Halobacteriovoraceae bacterium]|jgi:L-threonylcarbamoyladenylate synthase|nr:hypothetical protein [Halobacteriovoraceae bacterium]MBT5092798.1 hypothetical protein [Halobacteriovoraceae bacterium]